MPKLCRIDLEDREGIHRELLRFVGVLKERLPVSKVYLFGSFAHNKVHEGSDIDLIIIGDFQERLFARIEHVLELTDLPIEPLVYTPTEFEEMIKNENPFLLRALREGKEL
jgi:hypothetical protein